MKKNLILGVTLCALVVTGCSSLDEVESGQSEQGTPINVDIIATREGAPSTRTEYEEGENKLIVKWNSDKSDKLGIFTSANGTNTNVQFKVTGDLLDNGKSANFSGTLNITDPSVATTVYGYYPRVEGTDTPTAIPIDLSNQTQTGIKDKESLDHLAGKDYMAATPVTKIFQTGNQSLSLAFNPLLTILSFEINKEMTVKSIKLEAEGTTNAEPFYTDGAVDITDGSFLITTSGTATKSITLNVSDGAIGSGAIGMFNMMIFPIESSKMPEQFKVTVTTTDGKTYTQTKKAPTTGFVRGKRSIMVLDNLELEDVWDGSNSVVDNNYKYSGGDGTATPYQISTAKDLAQLAANVNAGSTYLDKHFVLTNNINLNGNEWTPIGTLNNPFQGTFNGGNNTITGLNITKEAAAVGLFGYFGGTIEDIDVKGEINIAAGTSSINAGGILGYCTGGTLSGTLTNGVKITTITTITRGFMEIGGVVGNLAGGKIIAGAILTNNGILNVSGISVNVGGVIGNTQVNILDGTSLTNSGAITGTGTKYCFVGGLIGWTAQAVAFKGSNTGNVEGNKKGNDSTAPQFVCSGGFIGCAQKSTTITVDRTSSSTGSVTANNTATEAGLNSYAGIYLGMHSSGLTATQTANKDADGNPGSTVGVTATSTNGQCYVNGVEKTVTTP